MTPDVRTAGVIGSDRANLTHGGGLSVLVGLAIFATAASADSAPPSEITNVARPPSLSALGPTNHTATTNTAQAVASTPAAALATGADETALDHAAAFSRDHTRIAFLHGLHSPFGIALAMSRMQTPR